MDRAEESQVDSIREVDLAKLNVKILWNTNPPMMCWALGTWYIPIFKRFEGAYFAHICQASLMQQELAVSVKWAIKCKL